MQILIVERAAADFHLDATQLTRTLLLRRTLRHLTTARENVANVKDNPFKIQDLFENLTKNRPLTWIGALPDALKKARNKAEIAEILGEDVTEASFKDLKNCDATTANARCYTIVSDLT